MGSMRISFGECRFGHGHGRRGREGELACLMGLGEREMIWRTAYMTQSTAGFE